MGNRKKAAAKKAAEIVEEVIEMEASTSSTRDPRNAGASAASLGGATFGTSLGVDHFLPGASALVQAAAVTAAPVLVGVIGKVARDELHRLGADAKPWQRILYGVLGQLCG